jgi:DNA damage-binding protein 1
MENIQIPLLGTSYLNSINSYQNGGIIDSYQKRNAEHSRFLHSQDKKTIEKYHENSGSDFLKSLIFGGLDGVVTSFAIICSAHASHFSYYQILILGLSNILAGAISMGHGDYFSEKAEYDYVKDQYEREKWEMANYEEGEINEMIELYTKKHKIYELDANNILRTMAKYKHFFIDHMMVIELGLLPPDEKSNAIQKGIVTFFSFLIFGIIPLLTYVYLNGFITACSFAILLLGTLGYIKATFTKSSKLWSCFITILNGSLSAGFAYVVSSALDKDINNS